MAGRGFEVMESRCDQCLFDPANRIVSAERAREVLNECRRTDTHFVCHKSTIADGGNVCCRGFYDANPMASNSMRIAARLGVVRFVPVPDVQ